MLRKLTQIGYQHAQTEADKRAYYFSNLINLTVLSIFLVILVADLVNLLLGIGGDINYFTSNILLELTCVFNLYLNSRGKLNLSRFILVFAIFGLLYVLTPILNPIRNEAYFWYPYAPTGTSLIVYFLFLKRVDQKYLVMIVLMHFALVVFSDQILDFLTSDQLAIKHLINEDYLSYKINPAMMFLFVNMTMYYAFRRSRNYESELIAAQESLSRINKELISKSADKDKFYSIVSHDLRGPFSSVVGLIKMMKDKPSMLHGENGEKFIEMLSSSTEQTFKLLENLLEWSRLQTGTMKYSPEKVSLSSLIDEVVAMLVGMIYNKGLHLTKDYENVGEVVVDINMIRTILRNLITNAAKFTPKGGHIGVCAEAIHGQLVITVSDSGVGMSKDLIERIFTTGEKVTTPGTNEEKGTGLGLLIVKEFVDMHHGNIKVASEKEVGTRFTIELPMSVMG